MSSVKEMLSNIIVDEEKKKRVLNLFKSLKEIDRCIEPFKEQRKELRMSYVEQKWLTKEEFSLAKKAYASLKSGTNLDDVKLFAEIGQEVIGGDNE